ncbi:hypothetical protein NDU88_010987, partial [Pleurodeles waltl]
LGGGSETVDLRYSCCTCEKENVTAQPCFPQLILLWPAVVLVWALSFWALFTTFVVQNRPASFELENLSSSVTTTLVQKGTLLLPGGIS